VDHNRTRFIAGGDKCNYLYKVATPTVEMLVAKILFNSVVSTPGTKFMVMDISNFYLMTSLLDLNIYQSNSLTFPTKSSKNTI